MWLILFFTSIYAIIIKETFQERNIYTVPQINDDNDGEQFIQNIIHGKTITSLPEHLIFTAPYKICKGGCEANNNNFNMVFPLYIGLKKSKTIFSNIYSRDYDKIYSSLKDAPFKPYSTMMPYTLCPTKYYGKPTIPQPTVTQPTESQPTTTQSTTSQLITTQPTTAQPTTTQPTDSQQTTTQPTATPPTESEPTLTQPTTSQTTASQPTTTQPTASPPPTTPPTDSQQTTTQPTATPPTESEPTLTQPTTSQTTVSQPITSEPTTTTKRPYNTDCEGINTTSRNCMFKYSKVSWYDTKRYRRTKARPLNYYFY